jgi:histidine ammonia-lyase
MEALAAVRALDLLRPLRTSPILERMRERIREVSAELEGDRPLYRDIERIEVLIAAGGLAASEI